MSALKICPILTPSVGLLPRLLLSVVAPCSGRASSSSSPLNSRVVNHQPLILLNNAGPCRCLRCDLDKDGLGVISFFHIAELCGQQSPQSKPHQCLPLAILSRVSPPAHLWWTLRPSRRHCYPNFLGPHRRFQAFCSSSLSHNLDPSGHWIRYCVQFLQHLISDLLLRCHVQ